MPNPPSGFVTRVRIERTIPRRHRREPARLLVAVFASMLVFSVAPGAGVAAFLLGLAIVADCVEALSGSIRCESAAGVGTTFYVRLPCEPSAR